MYVCVLICVSALSKEPVAPVPAPQPAPGQQQREVTIQFQQAAPPPSGPVAPVEVPLGVTTTMQYPMMHEDEEPPRCVMTGKIRSAYRLLLSVALMIRCVVRLSVVCLSSVKFCTAAKRYVVWGRRWYRW